eukprot:365621-Chlamydomonas_euryale.AAC.11
MSQQDLTPDNYDALVNGAKHAIVEFYAPCRCRHSARMPPALTPVLYDLANTGSTPCHDQPPMTVQGAATARGSRPSTRSSASLSPPTPSCRPAS